MRSIALGTVAVAVGWLLAAPGDDAPRPRPDTSARPTPPAIAPEPAADPRRVVVAPLPGHRVAALHPVSLRPVAPPARVGAPGGPVAVSRDGRYAAFGHLRRAAVRVVDLSSGRAFPPLVLDPRGPVVGIVWTAPDRLTVFAGSGDEGSRLFDVDPVGRSVLGARQLDGDVVASAARRGGAAAVLAPAGSIGKARLLITGTGAAARTVRLGDMRAGTSLHLNGHISSRVQPGLAIDRRADVAHVVDAERRRLARVRLGSGEVRLRGLTAVAAKGADGRTREAQWLGDGRLAVAGWRDRPDGTIAPYGLRVVHARTWRERVIDRGQSHVVHGAGRLLAWDADRLRIYDHRGRLRHRLRLDGVDIHQASAAGRYAWVHTLDVEGEDHRMLVVDMRRGRVVRRARRASAAAAVGRATAPLVLGVDFDPRRTRLRPGINLPRGNGALAWRDPLTLRRVSRRVRVRGYVWGWDRAPDGRRVALGASNRGRVQIVDVGAMRTRRLLELPVRQPAMHVRWAAPDRLLAVTGFAETVVWELDLSGEVRARHDLGGRALAVEPTPDGLAVLVPAQDRTARLALVRAGSEPRLVALPGIAAHAPLRTHHDLDAGEPPELIPGLAVGDGAAWVVNPGALRVARVDLSTGRATEHDVTTARSAKGLPFVDRRAAWLGDGLLAVSGAEGGDRVEPFGLRVVDTRTWRVRTIDATAAHLQPAAGLLLYPRYERRRHRRPALFAYAPDGSLRFAFRPRFGMSNVTAAGVYAYVQNGARHGGNHRTYVIDLRTGRRVATLRTTSLPTLLAR